MIAKDAKLCVAHIPLSCLQVGDYDTRYPEKLTTYMNLLNTRPHEDTDPLIVTLSETHTGMYTILNGHHRYCAHIMTGRKEILCVVVAPLQGGSK